MCSPVLMEIGSTFVRALCNCCAHERLRLLLSRTSLFKRCKASCTFSMRAICRHLSSPIPLMSLSMRVKESCAINGDGFDSKNIFMECLVFSISFFPRRLAGELFYVLGTTSIYDGHFQTDRLYSRI